MSQKDKKAVEKAGLKNVEVGFSSGGNTTFLFKSNDPQLLEDVENFLKSRRGFFVTEIATEKEEDWAWLAIKFFPISDVGMDLFGSELLGIVRDMRTELGVLNFVASRLAATIM